MTANSTKSEPKATLVANFIADELIKQWKSSISPLKSKAQISKQISDSKLELRDIKRRHERDQDDDKHKERIANLDKLLDIAGSPNTRKRKREPSLSEKSGNLFGQMAQFQTGSNIWTSFTVQED